MKKAQNNEKVKKKTQKSKKEIAIQEKEKTKLEKNFEISTL